MNTTKARNIFRVRVRWRTAALYGGLFAGLGILQFLMLGSLLAGYSTGETQAYQAGLHINLLGNNPANLPFYLAEHLLITLMPGNMLAGRLTSALFGFLVLIVFCLVLRAWYGRRTALLGTALLGSSSWFLHLTRSGTPDVLVLGLFIAFACGIWLRRTSSQWAVMAVLGTAAVLLYVPGMIWLIAMGAVWQWRALDRIFMRRLWAVSGGAVLLLGAAVPLVWALYHSPELYKTIIGLPQQGWPKPLASLRAFAEIPLHIFVRQPAGSPAWLGDMPLVDLAATIFFCFGAYACFWQRALARSKLLLTIFAVGGALAAIGGMVVGVLAPFAYLTAAGGVRFLLDKWLTVFPRNPIAKNLALGMMTLVVVAACTYNVRAYFIAWPQATLTETIFTQQNL